jgi:thymidylate kinase
MTGFFITFEGGEGSGKTTQLKALLAYLHSRRLDAVQTRDPGGTTIGKYKTFKTHMEKMKAEVDGWQAAAKSSPAARWSSTHLDQAWGGGGGERVREGALEG